MAHDSAKIGALIGSRICHDLISPVGAVANGLELLEMSGVSQSLELSLVNESVSNASARIRFFRLAFGDSETGEHVSAGAVADILAAFHTGARTETDWRVTGDLPRAEVKLALLAVLCAEQALPTGGRIVVTLEGGHWRVVAEAERLAPDPALWAALEGQPLEAQVSPATVQFVLLPVELAHQGRNCTAQVSDKSAEIRF